MKILAYSSSSFFNLEVVLSSSELGLVVAWALDFDLLRSSFELFSQDRYLIHQIFHLPQLR